MAVLTAAARLTDEFADAVRLLGNRFPVSNLGLARVCFDLEFSEKTVSDDVEVQLAHTCDKRLPRFLIRRDDERRVFFRQTLQGNRELFLVGFALRLNAHGDNGLGERRRFETDFVVSVAESVARYDVLRADNRADCARVCLFNIVSLVRFDNEQARDTFGFARTRVVNCHTLLYAATVYAYKDEFADERVGPQFESQSRRSGEVVGDDFQRGRVFVVFAVSLNRGNVERAGEVVDNCVEQHLHALVLERRTGDNADKVERQRSLADAQTEFVFREVCFAFEESFHNAVVEIGDGFDKFGSVLFRLFLVFGGNFNGVVLDALRVVFVIDIGLHRNEVYQAFELVFRANGEEQRVGIAAELCFNVFDRAVEVRARSVHLVDESNAGNVVLVHLTPNRFGLGLNARDRAEYRDSAVENTQRTFNFGSEVDVSRGVDKVDLVFDTLERTVLGFPVASNSRRCNRDTAFAFLLHPVGHSRAFVNFANLVDYAAIKQYTFRASCFARVDVRRNTDVSRVFQGLDPVRRIFFG